MITLLLALVADVLSIYVALFGDAAAAARLAARLGRGRRRHSPARDRHEGRGDTLMGYAARSNAAARAAGKPRPRHTYTTSGPVSRPLRLTDADGREIYREMPWGQVVRVSGPTLSVITPRTSA